MVPNQTTTGPKSALIPKPPSNYNELPTPLEPRSNPVNLQFVDLVRAQTPHLHRGKVVVRLHPSLKTRRVLRACAEMKWQCQIRRLGPSETLISWGSGRFQRLRSGPWPFLWLMRRSWLVFATCQLTCDLFRKDRCTSLMMGVVTCNTTTTWQETQF